MELKMIIRATALAVALFIFAAPASATTFWIRADGTIIFATSDPTINPVGAVTSTELAPVSGRQTWDFSTQSWNPPPPPPLPVMTAEDLWEVLRAKGVLTDADVPGDRRRPPRTP